MADELAERNSDDLEERLAIQAEGLGVSRAVKPPLLPRYPIGRIDEQVRMDVHRTISASPCSCSP